MLLLQDLPDKTRLALGGISIGAKTNRFTIRFSDGSSKPIELYADDAQTKSEWLEGIGSKSELLLMAYHLLKPNILLVGLVHKNKV